MSPKPLQNRTFFVGDNLPSLQEIKTNVIDLIYIDPPFNKNKDFHAFKDTWHEQTPSMSHKTQLQKAQPHLHDYLQALKAFGPQAHINYLFFMAIRLMEMHRILKSTGTLYYHCDSVMSHYVKGVMDYLFGWRQFRNEIIWHYPSMSRAQKNFPQKHDILLRYSKSSTWTFNSDEVLIPYAPATLHRAQYKGAGFRKKNANANYLTKTGKTPDTVWTLAHIKSKKEHTGYPTQKPIALLERVIKASSHQGDFVLDAFSGSGSFCVAAETLQRQWIAMDINVITPKILQKRLNTLSQKTKKISIISKQITSIHSENHDKLHKVSPSNEIPYENPFSF